MTAGAESCLETGVRATAPLPPTSAVAGRTFGADAWCRTMRLVQAVQCIYPRCATNVKRNVQSTAMILTHPTLHCGEQLGTSATYETKY